MNSAKVQKVIRRKTGIYSTVGISNSTPLHAIRLRRASKKTTVASIYVAYSKQENKKSINIQKKDRTN